MIGFLDETGKGVITKEAFLKFMTARLVKRQQSRTTEINKMTSNRLLSISTILIKDS